MQYKTSLLFGIIGIIVIYAIILILSDLDIIFEKINQFDTNYLFIIFPLIPLAWMTLFVRWNYLLKENGITIPLKQNFLIFMSGAALGVTPGKIGELIKSQFLKNKFNISRSQSGPIIVVERFYDFFAVAVISFFGMWFFEFSVYIFILLSIGIILFFAITTSERLFLRFLGKISKIKFLKNFSSELPKSFNVFKKSTRGKILPISLSLSILYWCIDSLIVYLTLLAFGIDLINYLNIIALYTTSIILGVISFLPLGIGVVEGSLAGFFTMNGIELSLATALVVFIRLFTRWIGVAFGFIALKFSNVLSIKKNDL